MALLEGMLPVSESHLMKLHFLKLPFHPSSLKLGTKSLTNGPLRDILDTGHTILIHVIKGAGSFYSQKVFSLLPGVPKVPTISALF